MTNVSSYSFGVTFVVGSLLTLLLLGMTAIDLDVMTQLYLAISLLLLIGLLRRIYLQRQFVHELNNLLRVFIILLGVYLTLRYFFWRTLNTISYHDFWSYMVAITLYAAELYAITIYLLGLFVNVHPLYREPVALPEDKTAWPMVDVLIPTYDEDEALLEVTLIAATQIRYPKDKIKLYLLDDGGTLEKCHAPDSTLRRQAIKRQHDLRQLCQRLGVYYLTREANTGAKAGNINAALPRTHGELILMLDADHVPTVDILEATLGGFIVDEKLALVQTPHFFINPDPLEKNLQTFQQMPSENEMFYSVVQRGLDFWNASFFCGSAAVIRRRALEDIGGIACLSVTEDAETAMQLHAQGYRSAYLRRPLVSGLQPPTFNDFVRQRVRWAQGMAQIFLLRNPLTQPGLRIWQKLSYINSSYFWFFGYARLIFMLAPTAYLVFGLKIYDATGMEMLAYTVPHLIASILVANTLFGKVRWTFISELYEQMQSFFTSLGIFRVICNPRSPKFVVTPKLETLENDYIPRLVLPFYLLLLVIVGTLVFGIIRFQTVPDEHEVIIVTMLWECLNLIIMLGAIGALLERRQMRYAPRLPVNLSAHIHVNNTQRVACELIDISMGGVRLKLDRRAYDAVLNCQRVELEVYNVALNKLCQFRMTLSTQLLTDHRANDVACVLSYQFLSAINDEVKAELVTLVHGDSERWRHYLIQRNQHTGIMRALWFLVRIGIVHTVQHFHWILRRASQLIMAVIIRLLQWCLTVLKRRMKVI